MPACQARRGVVAEGRCDLDGLAGLRVQGVEFGEAKAVGAVEAGGGGGAVEVVQGLVAPTGEPHEARQVGEDPQVRRPQLRRPGHCLGRQAQRRLLPLRAG